MKKRNYGFILMIGILICLLCACVSSTEKTIQIGKDTIATFYSVVGERKITGTEKGFKNDVTYKILRYSDGDVTQQDVYDYLAFLSNEEYLLLEVDKSQDPLKISLGKSSSEAEKVILIDMQYTRTAELEISYKVEPGTITPKGEN